MPTDLDTRRRRASYRAHHRGTKEMDWLLGRYADARLAAMADAELGVFERVLQLPEPELQAWLMNGVGGWEPHGPEIGALVDAIRVFHGLEPTAS